jgi:hypothetical protein
VAASARLDAVRTTRAMASQQVVGESMARACHKHLGMDMEPELRGFGALSTMRAIMSGDSGPPRSETNTNADVLSNILVLPSSRGPAVEIRVDGITCSLRNPHEPARSSLFLTPAQVADAVEPGATGRRWAEVGCPRNVAR